MTLNTLPTVFLRYLRSSFTSPHRFLILLGSMVGLAFLPTWLGTIFRQIHEGASDCIINFGFIALAAQAFWNDRDRLTRWSANEEDELLGHLLIVGGVLVFPFIYNSVSFQALVFAWVLMGMTLSTWGLKFFKRHGFHALLVLISIYPNLQFIAIRIFRLVTPHESLERLMAWTGSLGLQAIGQAATSQSAYVNLPEGSVLVAPGCNGFAMAFTLAGTGLILGLFMKLKGSQTAQLILSGIAISLIFNIPRIMLLANAAVYWGEKSFEFWHGAWGGQIFASVMFTVYYYVAMAIIDQDAKKKSV